jgi:hypothetical protein
MNIPIIFGWQQIILLIVGLVGVWLLASMGVSLIRRDYWHKHAEGNEFQKHGWHEPGHPRLHRHHRPVRWRRGITGILLLLLASSLLWLTFIVQTYLGLTGEIKVAHIRATAIANVPHEMSVELILYASNGHPASDNTYLVQGDEWMLQGDIVKFPTWINVIGLHSGYKLTRLEGRFEDPNLERNSRHTVVVLNGGDDNFFKTAYAQKSWFSWFVDASYGNAVFQAPGAFDVFATQDALIARPTGQT